MPVAHHSVFLNDLDATAITSIVEYRSLFRRLNVDHGLGFGFDEPATGCNSRFGARIGGLRIGIDPVLPLIMDEHSVCSKLSQKLPQ